MERRALIRSNLALQQATHALAPLDALEWGHAEPTEAQVALVQHGYVPSVVCVRAADGLDVVIGHDWVEAYTAVGIEKIWITILGPDAVYMIVGLLGEN